MRVVIAPDSFGGTLSPVEAADAIAAGWRSARPHDELLLRPMSDGGEGLLAAVEVGLRAAGRDVVEHEVEVAGPLGLPVTARWMTTDDGQTAVIESALACGLHLLDVDRRNPLQATTWGVGQLVLAAVATGARRVLIGLGGSATVDGGAGALSGLGWRLTVADGSGLKIGGGEVARLVDVAPGWVPGALDQVLVEVLADVRAHLDEAATSFGPQKGADPAAVASLTQGLEVIADVLEAAFERPGLREQEGSGAAGGLGFAFAAAHGAEIRAGAAAVADLVALDGAIAGADLVVTGEGRLDATSLHGKVVGHVVEVARRRGVRATIFCGQVAGGVEVADVEVTEVSPDGPSSDAAARLQAAVEAWAAGRDA